MVLAGAIEAQGSVDAVEADLRFNVEPADGQPEKTAKMESAEPAGRRR